MKTLWSLGPIFPLIVPCYHFTKVVDANAYLAHLRGKLTPKEFDRVLVHKGGSETYISLPHWEEQFGRLQDRLFFLAKQQEEQVYEKEVGYSPNKPYFLPPGAKIVYLSLQGTHRYIKAMQKLLEELAWLQKTIKGPREAASACSSQIGDDMEVVQVPHNNDKQPFPFVVFAGKEVRMVLVSHELLYTSDSERMEDIGLPNGCLSTVFFLTFTNKKWKNGRALRITCKWLTGHSDDPEKPDPPEVIGMDSIWARLHERAWRRFDRRCVPYCRELEPERRAQRLKLEHSAFVQRHRELVALATADRDSLGAWMRTFTVFKGAGALKRRWRFGSVFLKHVRARIIDRVKGFRGNFFSYRTRVRALGWDDALSTVKVPWHLLIVFQEHLWETGRMVSLEDTRSLFLHLLEVHPCTPDRRTKLRNMAEIYIAPLDPLWEAENHS